MDLREEGVRRCACTEVACSYLCVVSGQMHMKTISRIISLAFSTASTLVSKGLS